MERSRNAGAPVRIGEYRLGRTLGKGSFGKVKIAEHATTGHKVAVKILNRLKIKSSQMDKKIRREIKILKLFKHPHIIRLYEVIETKTDIFMVMEYVSGGELFDYIVARGRLSENDARRFFQQIISGVEYCHMFWVAHRDLKPENLLLDGDGNVKIGDFGLSNIMSDGEFLRTSCGSPNYAAPEVISGRLYAGPEVDVWSCGVILFALLCGRLPFDEDNIPSLFRKIREGNFRMPTWLPHGSRDLISKMLVVDPLKRISIEELRRHPWFQQNLPLYLSAAPDVERLGVMEIDDDAAENAAKLMDMDISQVLQEIQRDQHTDAKVTYQLIVDAKRRQSSTEGIPIPTVASSPPMHAFSPMSPLLTHGLGSPGLDQQPVLSPLGATPMSAGITMSPVSVFGSYSASAMQPSSPKSVGPQLIASGSWALGVFSKKLPHTLMDELYSVLVECNMDWEIVGEFGVKCRYPKGGPRNGERPVCIGIQLFVVPEGGYLIEFRRMSRGLLPFLDLIAELYKKLQP